MGTGYLHQQLQYQRVHPDKGLDWDPCNHSLETVETYEQFWIFLASSVKHENQLSQSKRTSEIEMDLNKRNHGSEMRKVPKKCILCLGLKS